MLSYIVLCSGARKAVEMGKAARLLGRGVRKTLNAPAPTPGFAFPWPARSYGQAPSMRDDVEELPRDELPIIPFSSDHRPVDHRRARLEGVLMILKNRGGFADGVGVR